jgi:mannose-6-phosphate isomerase-like protein (cupin superfamily)
MKAKASDLLKSLPGKASNQWPDGERFISALAHGSMSVELYAPVGHDPQTPHEQDELYFIHTGTGRLMIDGEHHAFEPGMVFSGDQTAEKFSHASRRMPGKPAQLVAW